MNRVRHAQTNAGQMFDPSAALPSTSLSAAEYKETEIKSNAYYFLLYIKNISACIFFFIWNAALKLPYIPL